VHAAPVAANEGFSFLKKKKQKTCAPVPRICLRLQSKRAKVFWFFFSKKNNFLIPSRNHACPGIADPPGPAPLFVIPHNPCD
jgi:hypothetical protein